MPSRFQWPIKRSPPADPQQYRVYRMESEAIGARGYATMTRSAMARFVRSLSREYGVQEPELRFADLGKWTAEWRDGVLTFNPQKSRSQNLLTVAHEFSHHLHEELLPGNKHAAHGPQFLACYMSVMDTSRIMPVAAMRAVCEIYRLEYADPGNRNSLTALMRAVRARE